MKIYLRMIRIVLFIFLIDVLIDAKSNSNAGTINISMVNKWLKNKTTVMQLYQKNRSILMLDLNDGLFDTSLDLIGWRNKTIRLSNVRAFDMMREGEGKGENQWPVIKTSENNSLDIVLESMASSLVIKGSPIRMAASIETILVAIHGKIPDDSIDNFHGLFGFAARSLTFMSPRCPFTISPSMLKDINVSSLTVQGVRNFTCFADQPGQSMDFNVSQYVAVEQYSLVDVFLLRLSEAHLNPFVFSSIQRFELRGQLWFIDATLFKTFKRLRIITLFLDDLGSFWRSTLDHKWLQSINEDYSFNMNMYEFVSEAEREAIRPHFVQVRLQSRRVEYTYPLEDICHFMNWPFDRAVFPMFYEHDQLKSNIYIDNCPLTHLAGNTYISNFLAQVSQQVHDMRSRKVIRSCNLEYYRRTCLDLINSLPDTYALTTYSFVITLVLLTLFCLFGFMNNFSMLCDLTKMASRDTIRSSFQLKYMLCSLCVNMAILAFSVLSLMNQCHRNKQLFCSLIQQWDWVRQLRIYLTGYVCESLRRFSLLILLLFSLDQYTYYSKSQHKLLLRLKSLNMPLKLLLAFVYSFLLSVFVCFQFDTQNYYTNQIEHPRLDLHELLVHKRVVWFMCCYLFTYLINDLGTHLLFIYVNYRVIVATNTFLDEMRQRQREAENGKASSDNIDIQTMKSDTTSNGGDEPLKDPNDPMDLKRVMRFICLDFGILRAPQLLLFISFIIPYYDASFFITLGQFLVYITDCFFLLSLGIDVSIYKRVSRDLIGVFKEHEEKRREEQMEREARMAKRSPDDLGLIL